MASSHNVFLLFFACFENLSEVFHRLTGGINMCRQNSPTY